MDESTLLKILPFASATDLQTASATVGTPCEEYNDMLGRWELIKALLGGTKEMREGGKRWLPQEPKESPEAYALRLSRSFLFNGYKDTLRKLIAKPFTKPVKVRRFTKLPEKLKSFVQDPDGLGHGTTQFAKELLKSAVNYGSAHVLVDYPKMPEGATRADELSVRPRAVLVSALNLIGWRWDQDAAGNRILGQVRIYECATLAVDRFTTVEIPQIRVFERSSWTVYQQRKIVVDDVERLIWVIVDSGENTLGYVPLFSLLPDDTASTSLVADPPMEDLAWMNLAHYQSFSDQRNVLRFARVGILFGTGFNEDDAGKGLDIGPNRLISVENKDANLKYVEHQGGSIEAGASDLQRLEERMESLGMQPLVEKSQTYTATGKLLDEEKSMTTLQSWVRNEEVVLKAVVKTAAEWLGISEQLDFSIDIFTDFGTSSSRGDADLLLKSRTAGEITRATYLNEMKRRGILDEALDVAKEAKATALLAGEPPIATVQSED